MDKRDALTKDIITRLMKDLTKFDIALVVASILLSQFENDEKKINEFLDEVIAKFKSVEIDYDSK